MRRFRQGIPGPDWLTAFRSERERCGAPEPGPPRWTVVGCLGSEHRAQVDPRGLVTPVPGGWSLDWWVGASDRWHLPPREAAIRQALVDDTPVVETVMRVPRGDVAQRVYAVPGRPALVMVEVENRSEVPVAVAFAIRPYHPGGVAAVTRIASAGMAVTVDGRPALFLPRAPAAARASTGSGGDCVHALTASEATGGWPLAPVTDAQGLAHAAFVYALPHNQTIRVAMPMRPARGRWGLGALRRERAIEAVDPARRPAAAEVVRGWQAQLRRGLRLELPDAALTAAVDSNRAFAVLFGEAKASARIRSALQAYGLADTAPRPATRPAQPHRPFDAIATWRRVRQLLGAASPTFTWAAGDGGHDPDTAAEFLGAVRSLFVREHPGADAALALCSLFPPEWVGRPVEVHDAPTAHGRVSYALRWHGDRPALLWECARPGIRLAAPGLDPSWSTGEQTGEALLAPFRGRVPIPLADQD